MGPSAEEFRGWPVRPPRQLPPLRQSRTRSQDRHFTRYSMYGIANWLKSYVEFYFRSTQSRMRLNVPLVFSSRSLLFENSGRYSAAAGLSSIPKLPFTKTGRLGGSNQDLGEEQLEEEEEDAEDAGMRGLVASVRSNSGAGTGGVGGGSMSRYSSK